MPVTMYHYFKYLLLFTVFFDNLPCLKSKSITIVLDTTYSMINEIEELKYQLFKLAKYNLSNIDNFILVPFKDSDVEPPKTFSSLIDLAKSFDDLSVVGGGDCPENSLNGIQKALEISQPDSYIFVFTDAYAKNRSMLNNIWLLCEKRRNQLVIFLSGSCSPDNINDGNIKLYHDITKYCSGILFQIEPQNLAEACKYIKEVTKMEWTKINTYDTFLENKEFVLPVEKFTTDITIAISGAYPRIHIEGVDSQLQNSSIENVIDNKYLLIIRVKPEVGQYKLNISSHGTTSVNIYIKQNFPFQYGFSTTLPNTIQETSPNPLPDVQNYILLLIPPMFIVELNSIEIGILDRNDREIITPQQIKNYFYVGKINTLLDNSFRIYVKGKNLSSYKDFSYSTEILHPQKLGKEPTVFEPKSEIITPDKTLLENDEHIRVACKVTAYPKPDIWWENDENEKISSENLILHIPTVYISYVTLQMNKNITLYCKAKNSEGENSAIIDIFVKQSYFFKVIQTPTDEIIECGTNKKLFCEVKAFPKATIVWYHNDSAIDNAESINILRDENALEITDMTLEKVGEYKCEIMNEVKTQSFTATIGISGLESPKLEDLNSEVRVTPGELVEVECRLTEGKPTPKISWKYKFNDYSDNIPDGVVVDDNMLKISKVDTKHDGYYQCIAENIIGQDSKEIRVKVQLPPIIKNKETDTVTVIEGDIVELPCEVNAIPKATVRWEMTNDDSLIPFDERHSTDHMNTHRFIALSRDSGVYHCTAENIAGTDEKTVTLNVLVTPYIQSHPLKAMTVNVGENVEFHCKVTYGNPTPSTKWIFVPSNSTTTTVLSRGNSSNNILHLNNVSKANEGTYLCVAKNVIGIDRIMIILKVQN